MAVAAGNKGKVTMRTSAGGAARTVAEMGAWTISGPGLNMIPYSAFQDERGRQKPGMMTAQTVTFNGYADFSTDVGQNMQSLLVTYLSSGTSIYPSSHGKGGSSAEPMGLKLWANDDSSLEGYGWWTQEVTTALTRKTYVTNVEIGQSKEGVGTIGFTLAVTGGNVIWQSSSS